MLAGGTAATVRLLHARDKELLQRGFEQLSYESRYNRFFTPKTKLLDAELRYLTELDQYDHFALVAVRATPAGEDGLGVARGVRLAGHDGVYEGAVTVVDAWQRRGLGALLMARLAAAAVERGATTLRFCVLPSNWSMRALIAAVAPNADIGSEGGILRVDVPLGAESSLATGALA